MAKAVGIDLGTTNSHAVVGVTLVVRAHSWLERMARVVIEIARHAMSRGLLAQWWHNFSAYQHGRRNREWERQPLEGLS